MIPRDQSIDTIDALDLKPFDLNDADLIISNPPHDGAYTVELIEHLRKLKPTWVLLPLDYLANDYMQKPLAYASIITPAKRLRLPGTKDQGTDNFVWVRFEAFMQRTTAFIAASPAAGGIGRGA